MDGPDADEGPTAEATVILDEPALAKGVDYFRLGALSVSNDGRLVAYSTDTSGGERFTLRIKNLATGELADEAIENTSGSPVWRADRKSFFYTDAADREGRGPHRRRVRVDRGRGRRVCRRQGGLNADRGNGREIHAEQGPKRFNRAGQALRLAASTARNSNGHIGACHRARLRRLDAARANKATAHQLARRVYAMLTRGEEYVDRRDTCSRDPRRSRTTCSRRSP